MARAVTTTTTRHAMAYTILLRTAHGWTDNLGQSGDANKWATESEAEEACAELRQVWDNPELKVVPTESLSGYDLIA